MLKIYNTLTGKKEDFKPLSRKKVNFFVCGPTVYDFSHIGHARTYIAFDVICRYLKEKGYDVFYLQNITDIDDKIIKRAKEKNINWKELARRFEKEYLKDMKLLGVNSVKKYARATSHIKEIISQVGRLLKKGYAYQISDGIYYDISKFKDYGKLSRRTALMAQDAVSRIDESKEKRNKGDFCLWKFSKPDEPKWKSPWGYGRPGWHIEDTAITEKYFGAQYTIHGGARDLIFPHHEAEIAQMEAISNKKPMVKYWLHTGFLTVNRQKMSKSLKNFITINDFLKKHSPFILRFFVLKSHYRSPVDYSEKIISQIREEKEKISEFVERIENCQRLKKSKERKTDISAIIKRAKLDFEKAMDDDFNTPKAIAAIFKFINKINPFLVDKKISRSEAKRILKLFNWFNKILGLPVEKKKQIKIPQEILCLVEKRERCRQQKKWKEADEIRKELNELGYTLEDIENNKTIIRIKDKN